MSCYTIRTTICDDVPVTVNFYYQPYEAPTQTYPGCFEDVLIESIFLGDRDFLDVLSNEVIAALRVECLESLEDSREISF